MSKVGRILFISEEDLRKELIEFWTDYIKNNVRGIVEVGPTYAYIDPAIFEKGIKNFTLSELIDIASVWVDTECNNEDYHAIAVNSNKGVKLISKLYVPDVPDVPKQEEKKEQTCTQ
jgi:hypothetical protein